MAPFAISNDAMRTWAEHDQKCQNQQNRSCPRLKNQIVSNRGLSDSLCGDWRLENMINARKWTCRVESRELHSHILSWSILLSSCPTACTMSLSQSLRTSVTPPELELVASEHLVEIIPLVSMDRTAFISVRQTNSHIASRWRVDQGAYGPLRPPNKCKIPLWMATNLKLKKKCHIVPPDWLNAGVCATLTDKKNV